MLPSLTQAKPTPAVRSKGRRYCWEALVTGKVWVHWVWGLLGCWACSISWFGCGSCMCSVCKNQWGRHLGLVHFSMCSLHFNNKIKHSPTSNVFWAFVMYSAPVLSVYMASVVNPVSWEPPPSHFTEDNTEALRGGVTCPGSRSECVVKVRAHLSS